MSLYHRSSAEPGLRLLFIAVLAVLLPRCHGFFSAPSSGVELAEVWHSTYVYTVVHSGGSLWLLTETSINRTQTEQRLVQLKATSGQTLATFALDSSYRFSTMVAADSSLFLLPAGSGSSVHQLAKADGRLLSRFRLLSVAAYANLAGVDAAGTQVLAASSSKPPVLYNTSDGRVLQTYTGGTATRNSYGAAYQPNTGRVAVGNNTHVTAIDRNNSVAWWARAPSYMRVQSMALADDHTSLHVLYTSQATGVLHCFDINSGQLLTNYSFALDRFSINRDITAGTACSDVFWADQARGVVHWQQGNASWFGIGEHPRVWSPTALAAVDADAIYMVGALDVVQLNRTGAVAARFDIEPPPPGSFLNVRGVAASADGRLFVTQTWNSTVTVYAGRAHTPVQSISTGSYTYPRAVAVTADGAVLSVISEVSANIVAQFDVATGAALRTLAANGTTWNRGLNDVAVDWNDDSVWAVSTSSLFHWAANGSALSQWRYNSSFDLRSLAVDAPHRRIVVAANGDRSTSLLTQIWWLDMSDGRELLTYTMPITYVIGGVAVTRDGTRLFVSPSGQSGSDVYIFSQQSPRSEQTSVS